LTDYVEAADKYYPSTGIDLKIVFEGSSNIYNSRQELAVLSERLSGLSKISPYIAEPTSASTYQNVMAGLSKYLAESGTGAIGNATLGDDNWPNTEDDFVLTLKNYASFQGPGAQYAQDVSYLEDDGALDAIRIQSEYVRLTKLNAGEIIDDADRQIAAMDDTRALVASWTDLPSAFPYSEKFIAIEGFKIIKRELFANVGMAIAAVAAIVFVTIASPMTAFLITLCVTACIVDILGFMYALGIVIDSVSVINLVLAVGLSVDYSAHVGHSFMTKKGEDRNNRVVEALADIGAAVLNGAISTFLAVVVLLFSSSYVFQVLSKQFALTVALGVAHGLILLRTYPLYFSCVWTGLFTHHLLYF
jgi:Niemann-Pick C1 protein